MVKNPWFSFGNSSQPAVSCIAFEKLELALAWVGKHVGLGRRSRNTIQSSPCAQVPVWLGRSSYAKAVSPIIDP
jgi:hypothetical protein